jgi:hypothetical protein
MAKREKVRQAFFDRAVMKRAEREQLHRAATQPALLAACKAYYKADADGCRTFAACVQKPDGERCPYCEMGAAIAAAEQEGA